MPAITSLDLSNAKLDVDHITAIATSTSPTATDRLGHTKDTMVGAINSIKAFNPRGAISVGSTYLLKDIYTDGGIAYLTVVPSFVSVSASADLAAGNTVIYQGLTLDELNVPLNKALQDSRSRFGRVSHNSLPNLSKKMKDYLVNPSEVYMGVSTGSSVGNGASLPTPSTQAPGPYFVSSLKNALDPAGVHTWQNTNLSVDGTSVVSFPNVWDTKTVTPTIPCLITYGMNDHQPQQFNNGQAFDNVYTYHAIAIKRIQDAGLDPVLCTTPHAHTGRTTITLAGYDQIYPTFIAAPTPEQLSPPASQSFLTGDYAGNGIPLRVNARGLLVNQAIRKAAADYGVPLIDVEPYWFLAIQEYGEDALFNTGESVHPNLLGHQQSYWKAIDDFCNSIATQSHQEGGSSRLYGKKVINPITESDLPQATLEIIPRYLSPGEVPFLVKARTGAMDGNGVKAAETAWRVDADGDLVSNSLRFSNAIQKTEIQFNDNVTTGFINWTAQYNIPAGSGLNYTVPDNCAGEIRISSMQPGVAVSQVYKNTWSSHNGVLTVGTPTGIALDTSFTVTISGLTFQPVCINAGTNLYIKMDKW